MQKVILYNPDSLDSVLTAHAIATTQSQEIPQPQPRAIPITTISSSTFKLMDNLREQLLTLSQSKQESNIEVHLVGYSYKPQDFDQKLETLIRTHPQLTISIIAYGRYNPLTSPLIATVRVPNPEDTLLSTYTTKGLTGDIIPFIKAYQLYSRNDTQTSPQLYTIGKILQFSFNHIYGNALVDFLTKDKIKSLIYTYTLWYHNICTRGIHEKLENAKKGTASKYYKKVVVSSEQYNELLVTPQDTSLVPSDSYEQGYLFIEENQYEDILANELMDVGLPIVTYRLVNNQVRYTVYRGNTNINMQAFLTLLIATSENYQTNPEPPCAKGTCNYAYTSQFIGYSSIIL